MTHAIFAFERLAAARTITLLWQAILLTALVAAVLRLLPRLSAAARFTAWAALFAVLLLLHFVPFPHASGSAAAAVEVSSRWSVAIIVLWAAASLWRAMQLVGALLRLRTVSRRARPVENFVPAPGSTARAAQLCLSADVERPSVIGFFHPRILIPENLYAALTREELDHILLHEQQHLRRRDDWLNLVQKIGLVLFPLNPALLWVERKLCFERELACDESVLGATNAPQSYARSLVSLAEHNLISRQLSLALGAWGRPSELSRRVDQILAARKPTLTGARAAVALSLLCIGVLGAAGALSRTPAFITFGDPGAARSNIASADAGSTQAKLAPAPLDHAANLAPHSQPTLLNAAFHVAPKLKPRRAASQRAQLGQHATTAARMHLPDNNSQRGPEIPSASQAGRTRMLSISATDEPQYAFVHKLRRSRPARTRSQPAPTIVFAMFESFTAAPSYAAVPTPAGWLIVQL